MSEGAPRRSYREQVADVSAIDHHAAEDGELWNRRSDAVEIGTERAAIEGQRLQRATAQGRALELLLVIRMDRIGAKFDLAVGFKGRNRLRAAIEECLAQCHRSMIADHAVEEFSDLLPAVVGIDAGRISITGGE